MDRLSDSAVGELEALCPRGITRDVDLSQISCWRIGGPADIVLRPSSIQEVAGLMRWFHARQICPVVIGQTTNLLFDDEGLRVPCLQIGDRMSHVDIDGPLVRAEAGVWLPGLARRAMQAGLTGLEHTSGIPGTLGGLICMNGGSQRKCIGSHVVSVDSVDAEGVLRHRNQDELGLSYRHSVFQDVGEIITSVYLRLDRGDRAAIRREMLEILASRSRKFPRKLPNCGSTFVSDPALYADYGPPGAIIESLGFKGYRVGGAQVSSLHANFLVNVGGATARDVLTVIRDINTAVENKTGRALLAEVRYVHPDGRAAPASLVARALRRLGAGTGQDVD